MHGGLGSVLLTVLLGTTASGPSTAHLSYTLTLVQDPGASPRVQVTVSTPGQESGETIFAVMEHWGGEVDLGQEIHDLRVQGTDGRELTPDQPRAHLWRVRHEPGELLTATYHLETPADRLPVQFEDHYRPVITDGLFHLIGNTGLLYPEHLEQGDGPVPIQLEWQGFKEAGWATVSSFGTDEMLGVELPVSRFRHALFLAGDVRLHPVKIRECTLQVAIHGDDWGFTDEQLVDLAHRIVLAEREFFQDFSDEFYLISAIPVGERKEGALSLGGTGLHRCFCLFMMPGMGLEPGSPDEVAIKRLLAHEYFHHWNGIEIQREDPEQLVYWFSEGFTDYFARRLLHRAGLYSNQEYVEDLNRSLREYYASPVRSAPNREIQEGFWTDRSLKDLPYRRGDVMALVIDHEIRQRSRGRKNLDDLMRGLLASSVNESKKVSTESLLSTVSSYTSEAFADGVREVIVEGATAQCPQGLAEPPLMRELQTIRPFRLGFDFEASRAAGVVTGVDPDSSAFEAGLRDGQKLTGYGINWGAVEEPIRVNVEVGGRPRRIRYLPRGNPVQIPQYSLAPSGKAGG